MSINNFDFDKLIDPIDVDIFFKNYWEQKPIHISRNCPNYYSDIFSSSNVEEIIYCAEYSNTKLEIFNNSKPFLPHHFRNQNINPNIHFGINKIYEAYFQGNTIKFNRLQDNWKPIAILSRKLEKVFNFKVNVNMYLTPNQSQGIIPHFDSHDVFVLQIEGAKLWRIYDSYLSLPLEEDRQPVPADKLGVPIHEVYLTAGDLLYIPRGQVHEALTSECSSLHITVSIHPFRFADLMSSALSLMSQQNLSLRKSLPIGFLNNGETKDLLKSQFKELLELISSNAEFEEALDHLAERFFSKMTPLPDGHFTQIDEFKNINIETIVKKRDGMFCRIVKEKDSVSIEFPGNKVRGPSHIESALRFVADSTEFPVTSMPGSLNDNGKLVLVRRLVREGLLTVFQK